MDVLERNMFNNQHKTFNSRILNVTSYNHMFDSFRANIDKKQEQMHDIRTKSSSLEDIEGTYTKKRSYSELLQKRSTSASDLITAGNTAKRCRTAPPSPFPFSLQDTHIASSAPETTSERPQIITPEKTLIPTPHRTENSFKVQAQEKRNKITLPSISTLLPHTRLPSLARINPAAPTVSLDYFDTYKPNDEQWRYGLLDTIARDKKHFDINDYTYLRQHGKEDVSKASYTDRPRFDSRISSKLMNSFSTLEKSKFPNENEVNTSARKINFPYESNYTYLNKTYMNDVKRFPEYLELAHSLIDLSKTSNGPSPIAAHASTSMEVLDGVHSFSNYDNRNELKNCEDINQALSPPLSGRSFSKEHAEYSISKTPTTPPIDYNSKTVFIPVTPPSVKSKKSEGGSSPRGHALRVCLSCGSDQSPCWRPSWSTKDGQLCNSCGLRYKKTSCRCLNDACKKIPAKGEWALMQTNGKISFSDGSEGYSCLECGHKVELKV